MEIPIVDERKHGELAGGGPKALRASPMAPDRASPANRSCGGRPITCTQEAPIRDALGGVAARRDRFDARPSHPERGCRSAFSRFATCWQKSLLRRAFDRPIRSATVMTHDPITLPTNAFALDAALAMARHGVHHIVVADGASIAGRGIGKGLVTLQLAGAARKSATRCARPTRSAGNSRPVPVSSAISPATYSKQGVSAKTPHADRATLNDVL